MGGTQSSQINPPTKSSCHDGPRPVPKNFVLLHGCSTIEEHEQKIAADIAAVKGLYGKEALSALGFEFRFIPCDLHVQDTGNTSPDDTDDDHSVKQPSPIRSSSSVLSLSDESYGSGPRYQSCHDCATRLFYVGKPSTRVETTDESPPNNDGATAITLSNRKQYISDGPHYDLIANLAQEAAQSIMCSEFNLEWVTICNDRTLGPDVRAMVDADHPLLLDEGENHVALQELLLGNSGGGGGGGGATREEKKQEEVDDFCCERTATTGVSTNTTKATLLIATGRGKVRAGIFSRQHLLTAGIEIGTAWHFVREARLRNWGVAVIDPNARGEGVGFDTFKRSFSQLFVADDTTSSNNNKNNNNSMLCCEITKPMARQQSVNSLSTSVQSSSIYILAHSAGGGQLVRHLREDSTLLPSIKAIAFTDSSHNVQWCKNQPTLMEFLQKKNCVYVRSNDVRSSQSCVRVSSRGKDIQCSDNSCSCITQASGKEVNTDTFWEHRFGKIKTVWAGSPDHSLSNYAGRDAIWGHFDEHT